jgi:hypothetical protein
MHTIKAGGGVEAWLHVFLNSALDRGEWSGSCSILFLSWEGAPAAH